MGTLTGQVVFITGAARGIGAGTARAVVAKGAKVVLTDLDAEPLTALAEELGEDRAVHVVADVCDLAAMEAAVAAGVERFGGIDVVMANAGIASYGSVLAVDPEAFRRVVDVNVTGVFHTVRAALPSVIERKGYVLVVASLASYVAAPGLVAYHASKAGAEHLANALRPEVAHHGVQVGSAHMSWIDTPLVQDARKDLGAFGEMISKLPWPLSRTTSEEACVRAFVRGIEKRSTRINVPGWVGLMRWIKPLATMPLGEREVRKHAPQIVPKMDAEVRALGRSMSERTKRLEDAEEAATPSGR